MESGSSNISDELVDSPRPLTLALSPRERGLLRSANYLQMGTLSKAVGAYGGYVCTTSKIADYLRNKCRSLIYSTALPPSVLASAIAALEIIESEGIGQRAVENARYFLSLIESKNLEVSVVIDGATGELPLPWGEGRGEGAKLKERARELKKNATEVEKKLWSKLRDKRFQNYKFRRQMPLGNYIADFVCWDKKLIIELYGGQHAEQQEYDAKRTNYLESLGFKVLRFWNNELIENMEGVLETIYYALVDNFRPLTPTLSPRERELPRGNRHSSIVPLILGDEERAINASKILEENGFLVSAIRPPTVPPGTARLRFTFSALHKREDIERLAGVIREKIV